MVIEFGGSVLEVTIYLLCVITSLLCAWLLTRAYLRGRSLPEYTGDVDGLGAQRILEAIREAGLVKKVPLLPGVVVGDVRQGRRRCRRRRRRRSGRARPTAARRSTPTGSR